MKIEKHDTITPNQLSEAVPAFRRNFSRKSYLEKKRTCSSSVEAIRLRKHIRDLIVFNSRICRKDPVRVYFALYANKMLLDERVIQNNSASVLNTPLILMVCEIESMLAYERG